MAGSVIVVFASNMLAPILFAVFVATTKQFDLAFLIAGACSLLCLPMSWRQESGENRFGEFLFELVDAACGPPVGDGG